MFSYTPIHCGSFGDLAKPSSIPQYNFEMSTVVMGCYSYKEPMKLGSFQTLLDTDSFRRSSTVLPENGHNEVVSNLEGSVCVKTVVLLYGRLAIGHCSQSRNVCHGQTTGVLCMNRDNSF